MSNPDDVMSPHSEITETTGKYFLVATQMYITSHSRVVLENLTVPQLGSIFLRFM
jgi:hypothetical protein